MFIHIVCISFTVREMTKIMSILLTIITILINDCEVVRHAADKAATQQRKRRLTITISNSWIHFKNIWNITSFIRSKLIEWQIRVFFFGDRGHARVSVPLIHSCFFLDWSDWLVRQQLATHILCRNCGTPKWRVSRIYSKRKEAPTVISGNFGGRK